MRFKNTVEFSVKGRYALFTDPLTRIGGEKFTYQVPTYEGLKGILSSVYWKPTIVWVIDKVRVMKTIQMQPKNIRPIKYNENSNDLAIYTYLKDVEYQVQAHFEWNPHRQDLVKDQNENKHFFVAKRMIENGGRRDIFLGTRECQGYVEPCKFGEGTGFYDQLNIMSFGMMFHGFNYPDESGKEMLVSRFWKAEMHQGILQFPHPKDCAYLKEVRPMIANRPRSCGLEEDFLLDGYMEEGLKQ
jgi:CRISPR-associated protein Cas5d